MWSWGISCVSAAVLVATAIVKPASAAPPDYYPADYAKIIEGSKSEGGLLIYSNISLANWSQIIKDFNAEYPWIKVETTDMRANEVFERYYADVGSNVKSADMLLSAAPLNWLEFLPKNQMLAYDSPEKSKVPAWSMPAPGVYTISTDPFVLVYNKLLVPQADWPKTMQNLADLASKNPGMYKGKVGTQGPNISTYSQGLYWSAVNRNPDRAYSWFEKLGPLTVTYRSANQALEKLTTGEHLLVFFANAPGLIPYLSNPASEKIFGWSFPEDAAVVYMRNFTITATAKSPNSAKLMTDFILSKKGQTAAGIGGLLPYRKDVDDPKAFRLAGMSFDKIVETVGEKNLILIDFNPKIVNGITDVGAKLDKIFAK